MTTLVTLTDLFASLVDNLARDILPLTMRNMAASLAMQHGQISQSGNALATSIGDTTSWFEMAASTPITSGISNILGVPDFINSSGIRLQYKGTETRAFHVAATVSFTTVSNNQVIGLRIGRNGVASAEAEALRKVSTGTDVGSTAMHLITTLDPDDYLTLYVQNQSSASNMTLVSFNLQAVGMIM